MKDKKIDYRKAKIFAHCKECISQFLESDLHKEMTPRDYGQYEASVHEVDGKNVLVVWCKRCGREVVNSVVVDNW